MRNSAIVNKLDLNAMDNGLLWSSVIARIGIEEQNIQVLKTYEPSTANRIRIAKSRHVIRRLKQLKKRL